jgi:hypothetical protein
MTRTLALAVAVALMRSDAPVAAPQARPTPPPTLAGDRVAGGSGGPISRYETMYGTPEFRGLDDEQSRPWPMRQAIRTIGRLEAIPGRGRSGQDSTAPTPGQRREWDSQLALHEICAERTCLAIVPVQELVDVFAGPASDWVHKNIEVIGAIDELRLGATSGGPVVFQVWSVFEAPDMPGRKKGSKGSSLEPLVRYPKGVEGTVVTVTGVFRGANLFEDMPPESRRDDSDWVLQDGPFSIWVTGKAPKGKGFSLDPRSRSDCRYRLEATGKVAIANGFIYLRASSLQLLGRAKEE